MTAPAIHDAERTVHHLPWRWDLTAYHSALLVLAQRYPDIAADVFATVDRETLATRDRYLALAAERSGRARREMLAMADSLGRVAGQSPVSAVQP